MRITLKTHYNQQAQKAKKELFSAPRLIFYLLGVLFQSTSSNLVLLLSSAGASSRGGNSSSPALSSLKIERPSLIILWMRLANWEDSSREKPEVKREVS